MLRTSVQFWFSSDTIVLIPHRVLCVLLAMSIDYASCIDTHLHAELASLI